MILRFYREALLQRTRALQKKQRAGYGAPSTRSSTPIPGAGADVVATPALPSSLPPSLFGSGIVRKSLVRWEVPDFTPLGAARKVVPAPSQSNALQFTGGSTPSPLYPSLRHVMDAEKAKPTSPVQVTPSQAILKPRYGELLEEARKISRIASPEAPNLPQPQETDESFTLSEEGHSTESAASASFDSQESEESLEAADEVEVEPEVDETHGEPMEEERYEESPGLGQRVKGFLYSYLPTVNSKSQIPTKKSRLHLQPGLPVPSEDILKKPRGPVRTPLRAPPSKPRPPKELVNLHEAPKPKERGTWIPRITQKPKRMVELNHVMSPEMAKEMERERLRESWSSDASRRSSGGSVRDLVKGFEEMDKKAAKEVKPPGKLKIGGVFGAQKNVPSGTAKPAWRY
jgi:hypothetical protein